MFAWLIVAAPSSMAAEPISTVGVWNVQVDTMAELLRTARQATSGALEAPLWDGISFDISRRERVRVTSDAQHALISSWLNAIAEKLVDAEEFEDPTDDELQEKVGMTKAQMYERLVSSQPFGQRQIAKQRAASDFHFLLREDATQCGGSVGGIGALVLGWYPIEGVQTEYGNVALLLFGIGDCGRQNPRARRYLSRIKREAKEVLYETLEGPQ